MRTRLAGKGFIGAAMVLLAATPGAFAQTPPGPPSGDGVQPYVVAGNPNCADLGSSFAYKVDPPDSGAYDIDGFNSVTVESDGYYFDWWSDLAMDFVIVKGGPNADVYVYVPEDDDDTDLHAPINTSNNLPYGISHIEFCYDYEVTVTKSADTTFTRTWQWDIEKSVAPGAWDLFRGDTGTSAYAVSVDRTGFTDSDWAVSGEIQVENATPFTATITGVTDAISGFGGVAVDCGVSFPYDLASGGALTCTYATALPDGSARTNTATATTIGVVGGGSGTAPVAFGNPTTEVNASVNVVDTNGLSWGPVSDDTTWTYERTFACDGDQGSHANVATIVETGQSDDATVSVVCRTLTVTKDARTGYERTWSWTLDKIGDQSELTLAVGQSFLVGYTVQPEATSEDHDFEAHGSIWIANGHPTRAAVLSEVTDFVGGNPATVDCPATPVPAGGSLECTWSYEPPDGSATTNKAYATLQNVAIGSDGTVTPTGTTQFGPGEAAVVFGDPSEVWDECIDVTDDPFGALGSVCADGLPMQFTYSMNVGPYEECGPYQFVNTASFVANDTGATGEDGWTVDVNVPCEGGCTLTPGYWKTHSEHGPAPYDDTWAQLPLGANQPFFLSGQTYYEVLWTAPQGNAYYILAHAWIAATLNVLNGASTPPEVMDAIGAGSTLFATYTPAQIGALKGNKAPRPELLQLAGLLDFYNNGLIGPGHCSEDATTAP